MRRSIIPTLGSRTRHSPSCIFHTPVAQAITGRRTITMRRGMASNIRRCVLFGFQRPQTALPLLESKWIASMLIFLAKHNLTIQLDKAHVPTPQRHNDEYVMDVLMASNHYTPAELRKLNYCRLFLNVITISDITKPSGKVIDESILNGTPSARSSRSTHLPVHQESPSANEWKLWKRAYLLWNDINGNLRTSEGEKRSYCNIYEKILT